MVITSDLLPLLLIKKQVESLESLLCARCEILSRQFSACFKTFPAGENRDFSKIYLQASVYFLTLSEYLLTSRFLASYPPVPVVAGRMTTYYSPMYTPFLGVAGPQPWLPYQPYYPPVSPLLAWSPYFCPLTATYHYPPPISLMPIPSKSIFSLVRISEAKDVF